jgi:hypothetical protein
MERFHAARVYGYVSSPKLPRSLRGLRGPSVLSGVIRFYNVEDYLDFVRYAPSTAWQLKHIRTRHIDIGCPLTRSADDHIRAPKDRVLVETLQRLFLHTPLLQSLCLVVGGTALWERKPQHLRTARWARMIVDLARLRRERCSEHRWTEWPGSVEITSSIVRFDVAVLPETIMQSAPWPSFARLPNYVRSPRAGDSPDLDRTLSWLLSEVIANTH